MSDPALKALIGQRVADRYELIEILGSGKYGIVWRVFDHNRGQISALKLMFGTAQTDAWREATLLTHLESDHILHVRNADVDVDVPYIETAIAENGTAHAALGPYGVDPSRAVHLVRGMLQGLELCHQRGLLHRDIKPSNVFLTANDDAQIGDFGVAAVMNEIGEAPPHGDPDIRAPELFTGAMATVCSDVYSAGLTLWAMVAGGLPFDFWSDGDAARHAKEVVAGPPEIRDLAPHASRSLAKIVRTAIHVDPSRRYSSAADFDRALAGLPRATIAVHRFAEHPGHHACWKVVRFKDGQEIAVCHSIGTHHRVDVRRVPSGTRFRRLCADAHTPAKARVKLREAFENLR